MSDRPNFLFVSVDSLRPDYCSFLDSDESTTPFLERLSNESSAITFERAITPSTWTLQVHASLFTGLYPSEHGVLDKGRRLGSHPTLATLLGNSGYVTESFGRNGWLESGEVLRGFTHHHTRYSQHIRKELAGFRDALGDGDLSSAADDARWAVRGATEKLREQLFRHTAPDSLTINAVTERLNGASSPFCFFVHLNGVHYVYRPTAPHHRQFGDHSLPTLARNVRYQRELVDNRGRIYTGDYDLDPQQNRVTADLYRGCIRQADSHLERLFDSLRRTGELENTVIVIFGDHGDHLGDGGHFGHQFSVDDALIRVPLLILDPTDSIPQDRADSVVQLNDLHPTALSMAGIDAPETRSVDLTRRERDVGYVYYSAPDSFIDRMRSSGDISVEDLPPTKQYAAWRSEDEKIVWYPEKEEYAGPDSADADLQERMHEHKESLRRVSPDDDGEMSRAVEDNLRRLGYL